MPLVSGPATVHNRRCPCSSCQKLLSQALTSRGPACDKGRSLVQGVQCAPRLCHLLTCFLNQSLSFSLDPYSRSSVLHVHAESVACKELHAESCMHLRAAMAGWGVCPMRAAWRAYVHGDLACQHALELG